jgi:hypothetical protein
MVDIKNRKHKNIYNMKKIIEVNFVANLSYVGQKFIERYASHIEYSSSGVCTAVVSEDTAETLQNLFDISFIEWDGYKWIELDGLPSGCGEFL